MEYLLGKLIIPHDKALHALYGLILYSFLCFIVSPLIAVVVVISIAALKEVYDYFNIDKHTVDIVDIVATALVPMVLFFLQWLGIVLAILF